MNLYNWEVIYNTKYEFVLGFINTCVLFIIPALLAFVLACWLTVVVEGTGSKFIKKIIWYYINSMRTIPFLMFVYLLYYGLPAIGIQIKAYTVALFGMTVYHGAYMTEILFGCWRRLELGQTEAGYVFGYQGVRLFRRIVLPQLLLTGAPLIGNQLIYMLKDTSFLMIITVAELTFVAGSIQGLYYIIYEPFVVAIVLYWILCLVIERIVRYYTVKARVRGIGYA